MLDAAMMQLAHAEAERFNLDLKTDFRGRHSPTPMSDSVQRAFADACDELRLTHTSLVSGAGHDGQSFAGIWPVGMIFVPSVAGTEAAALKVGDHKTGHILRRGADGSGWLGAKQLEIFW